MIMSGAHLEQFAERYPFNENELGKLFECYDVFFESDHNSKSLLQSLSHNHTSEDNVPKIIFIEDKILPSYFSGNLLILIKNHVKSLIYNETSLESGDQVNAAYDPKLPFVSFLEVISDCGRRGPKQAAVLLFELCTADNEIEYVCAHDIISLSYRLFVASSLLLDDNTDDFVDDETIHRINISPPVSLVHSLVNFSRNKIAVQNSNENHDENRVSKNVFMKWIDEMVPLLPLSLSTFIHNLIFPDQPYPPSRNPFPKPQLSNESDIFHSLDPSVLFPFCCMSFTFDDKWSRLYSIERDSSDFSYLENSIVGYGGPTLLIIKAMNNEGIFGAYTSSPWKQSNTKFYGNDDSFLFQLSPVFQVYHPTYRNSNYMYLNSKQLMSKSLANGLGFGGSPERPRLFISQSLEDGYASAYDTSHTFAIGDLLPKDYEHMERFHVESMEIWGVGGEVVIEEALRKQANHRDVNLSYLKKVGTISDKKSFLNDFKTGLIESKAYSHRHDSRMGSDHGR